MNDVGWLRFQSAVHNSPENLGSIVPICKMRKAGEGSEKRSSFLSVTQLMWDHSKVEVALEPCSPHPIFWDPRRTMMVMYCVQKKILGQWTSMSQLSGVIVYQEGVLNLGGFGLSWIKDSP